MVVSNLIDRMGRLPNFNEIPQEEIEWLVAHGQFEVHKVGTVLGPKGKPLNRLWIILSGCIAVRIDRGIGPRLVIEWRSGEVSGMLPYSRMISPPGDNYIAEKCELLSINTSDFKEMIQLCPKFTAYTVHLMLDRARSFKVSDLQYEKMISLGKLAAGLAHELNNPASAVLSGAKMLLPEIEKANSTSRILGSADLTVDQLKLIEKIRTICLNKNIDKILSPLELTEREFEISEWLLDHKVDPNCAHIISETSLTFDELNELAESLSEEKLTACIQWIATGCTLSLLASDIENAAGRISDLVSAVKRFTYMDNLGKSEFADIETGLRDTIKVITSKINSKKASIELYVEENLPRVKAVGSDLNQLWMNIIDNALDAIYENGYIKIKAHREQNYVLVSISDNGPGIPENIISQHFDPFFTTKPPGMGIGLGLDIAKKLVNSFRGNINVRSQKGWTEFRISIPIE
jgi:signal transduction histidine kinase